MKSLKKVIFSLLLILFVPSCAPSDDHFAAWSEKEGVKVLATTAQVGDLVRQIGGERVDVCILIQGELDPHSYEFVKGDAEKLERADWIFYNGLGLEHGASLLQALKNSSKASSLGEQIARQSPHQILTRGGVIDPHLWMDISLWKRAIGPITERLIALDPEGADLYRKRGEELLFEMEKTDRELRERLFQISSEKRYLVTSHDAFHYFVRAYLSSPEEEDWQKRFAAPEGLAPEGQLHPKDLKAILSFVKEKKVHVLFPESNVSRDSLRKILSAGGEMGLTLRISKEPLYGDSMGKLSYLEMMRHNVETVFKQWETEP